ncbi:MAG: ATP-binding protein [Planctomycetota bacterium]
MAKEELRVRSHVGRDLMQSAGLFRAARTVVWEYVSNGLQYVDPGVSPTVHVKLDQARKRIVVRDNGRGMDWTGLQNFFVMHGENEDRRAGRPGRGMFGTGKSAAFGIADELTITTVRGGKRSKVKLTRQRIESAQDGSPIEPEVLEREVPTDESNGTVVEIDHIHLRRLDRSGVTQFIERHLSRWPRDVSVTVNNHECEYAEPPVLNRHVFKPEGALRDTLGDVELVVKVAPTPLDDDTRGVSVLSNGVWHEATLGTVEGKEMAAHLFGEVDVPALDADTSPVRPFDVSRSMSLNPENPVVQAIHAFVSINLESVRRQLVASERDRRKTEEAKRLARTASEIANVLNDDFLQFKERLKRVRAAASGAVDVGESESASAGDDDLVFGSDEPAVADSESGAPGPGDGESKGGDGSPSKAPALREGGEKDPKEGQRVGAAEGQRRRPKGGFSVEFMHLGDQHRAVYVAESRAINVNLDHPQVKSALGGGNVEDPTFKRLAYEVAFTEYAVAIHMEMAMNSQYIDMTDPIVDVRDTIDRISRRTAALYERASD